MEGIGARYLSAREHDASVLPEVAGGFDLVYEGTGASGRAFDVPQVPSRNAVFVFTGIPVIKPYINLDSA
jgi:hypothetical protein